MAEGYKGSKNFHGPSRAKLVENTSDGTDYTATADDQVIVADTTSSTQTITLPAVADIQSGKQVEVQDGGGNAATNNVTITANSDDANINGADQDVTLATNYGKEVFVYNGTQWLNSAEAP